MADENDEEQEDVLALAAERVPTAAPAHKIEDGIEGLEDFEHREGPERAENGAAPVLKEGEPWAAVPPAGGKYPPGDRTPEDAAQWWEPAETLGRASAEAVRTAGKTRPETSGMGQSTKQSGKMAQAADGEFRSGLEELYRRTAQAAHPAVQNLPVEQAGRTLRAEEPGRTAALTVDELDRAVRRDSRRYDGGITIF